MGFFAVKTTLNQRFLRTSGSTEWESRGSTSEAITSARTRFAKFSRLLIGKTGYATTDTGRSVNQL